MNLREAIQKLVVGKKLSRPDWTINDFIYLDELGNIRDDGGNLYDGPLDMYGWILYEEITLDSVINELIHYKHIHAVKDFESLSVITKIIEKLYKISSREEDL